MKTYGVKSALLMFLFVAFVTFILFRMSIGTKREVSLLEYIVVIGTVFLLWMIFYFNYIKIGLKELIFFYPFNPFKRQKHILLSEIKEVKLVNKVVRGTSARIVVVMNDGTETTLHLMCWKSDLKKIHEDLRAKGINANTFFY